MNLPTFSQLPRWFACQMGDVLPAAQESSEDSRAGDARHTFFQRVAELAQGRPVAEARELALCEAPDEYAEVLAAIPVERLGLDAVAAEVALAIDLTTGEARELGRGIGRDYSSRKPTEIVGTIDRLALVGDDGIYVGDYKGRSHRRRVGADAQILAAALAGSRVYGRSRAELEVIRVVGDDVYPESATATQVDLDLFELSLQERAAKGERNREAFKADGTLPEAEVGEHCRYCPHVRFCPAQMSLARAVLGAESDEIRGIVTAGAAYLTDESAPRVYELVRHAEERLKVIKAALQVYARQTPFDLPDGRRYGVPPEAREREITDGRLASQALVELFDVDGAMAGTKVEVTFEGIERAVKTWISRDPKRGYRGAIKEGVQRAETLLAERGLLRVSTGGVVKAYKPKEA